MKNKLFTYLSNLTLVIGGGLGLYVLIDFIIQKIRLPAGACPLSNNKPLVITAIVLLATSFVFSIFEQRQKKKRKQEKSDTADAAAGESRDATEDGSAAHEGETGEITLADETNETILQKDADDINKS